MNKFGIIIFIIGTLFSGAFVFSNIQVSEPEYQSQGIITEDSSYSERLDGYYICRADLVIEYGAGSPPQIYTAETFATMESSNSCVDLIENYYPVGDEITVYFYLDSPEEYWFQPTGEGSNALYTCCAFFFALIALGGLIMTFTLGASSKVATKTGGLSGRSTAGQSSGRGHTGGLSGRNEQTSKHAGVQSITDPNFTGPHNGKFLSGHTRHGNRKFSTFQEAKEYCLADSEAGGITMEGPNHFTIRRENNLLNSSSGEVSWVKKVEYNTYMAGSYAQSNPTPPSQNRRLGSRERNYDSLIQRFGLRNVPPNQLREKVIGSGIMTPMMADKFFANGFVVQTLGIEQVTRQPNTASTVLKTPKNNFWNTADSSTSAPTSGVQEKCGHIGCSRSVSSFDFRCFDCRKRFCNEHRGATFQCSECA